MKYKVVFTHNPQDYYEGYEAEDLNEVVFFDDLESNRFGINAILQLVREGYTAIICPEEGQRYG